MATETTRRPTTAARVRAWTGTRWHERPDRLVTEEPIEIRVEGPGGPAEPLAVLMRTPGHDFDLAVGFCLTEGVVETAGAVREVRYCVGGPDDQEFNVVTVAVRGPVTIASRPFAAAAGCGVCGKATLDELAVRCDPVGPGRVVAREVLASFPGRLRDAQPLFATTGGLHAAGLMTPDGTITVVREDVGRHNAVDKLVGRAALADALPLADVVLVVSGRLGFEIVQKAARAGIALVASVSAPSSLAVATAERFGMTLAGFVREGALNVYSGAERVVDDG